MFIREITFESILNYYRDLCPKRGREHLQVKIKTNYLITDKPQLAARSSRVIFLPYL